MPSIYEWARYPQTLKALKDVDEGAKLPPPSQQFYGLYLNNSIGKNKK